MSYLFRYTSIQLVQSFDDMTPVNDGSAILGHLVQDKIMEELQQVPVSCDRIAVSEAIQLHSSARILL